MILDPTCGPYYDEENKAIINRDGVSYYYWKYHPYPVEETWAYYNDVYYTDENKEVASGWSNRYDIFTEDDMYAGIIPQESCSYNLLFVYLGVTVLVIIFFISFKWSKKKRIK